MHGIICYKAAFRSPMNDKTSRLYKKADSEFALNSVINVFNKNLKRNEVSKLPFAFNFSFLLQQVLGHFV